MKWRDQYTTVQQIQAQRIAQQRRVRRFALGTVARCLRCKAHFQPHAHTRNVPRQVAVGNQGHEAGFKAPRETFHVSVSIGRHYFGQVRAQRRQGQRVRRKRGAHAGVTRRLGGLNALDALPHRVGEAIHRAGKPTSHGLARDEEIRLQTVAARVPAQSTAQRMRLVDGEQRTVPARQFPQGLVEARRGQHHAAVGHHRFGQYAGIFAGGQGRFQRGEVVEGDASTVQSKICCLAHEPGTIGHLAVCFETHHRVLDLPVVAVVEHQHAFAPGDGTGPTKYATVGVAGRHGDLPPRQAEAGSKQRAHFRGDCTGQHGSQPLGHLRLQGSHHRWRRMTEHGAGVAEAEVDIRIPVHVGERGAGSTGHMQGFGRAPVLHPVQRHAAQPVVTGLFRQRQTARMQFAKTLTLGAEELLQGGHRQTGGEPGLPGQPGQ